MMYVLGEPGQLCNQLFQLAHHVGNSLHYKYQLACPVFQYKTYFPNLREHPQVHVSRHPTPWRRKLAKLIAKGAANQATRFVLTRLGVPIIAKPYVFSDADNQLAEAAKWKPVLVTTWLFRDYVNFNRNAESIRYLFKPDAHYAQQASLLLQPLQQAHPVIVGVHIRRGDYKEWEDGRYYFDDTVYRMLMQHLLTLPGFGKAGFMLCSNEPINAAAFDGLPVLQSTGAHFMTDLTVLSLCNYLIGPPSTFSAWASFMGQVPLYHINTCSDRPLETDFAVSAG